MLSRETAVVERRERAVVSANEVRCKVIRSWPGVADGAIVDLKPDRAQRLFQGGFVTAV